MDIKVYKRDYLTLAENLTPKAGSLRFTTQLNGGFGICTFKLKANVFEAWEWIHNRVFYHLVVSDQKKTLFEGRVEDIALTSGIAEITAYGYYANLSDIPYTTAYNDTAKAVLAAVLTANCSQISSDQSHLLNTDITITSAADESYLDITTQQLVEKLLAFSDTTSGKWFFAIWEDRKPYLIKQSISSVDWLVSLSDFTGFKLKHRGADLYNSCYAIYDAGGLSRTTIATNTASQGKYGLNRRMAIANLGAVVVASAEANRNAFLQEHKDIWPRTEGMVLGAWVYDANGVRHPSSHVRAGQVIRIKDLVPETGNLDSVTRDGIRTFYIIGTNYRAETAQMDLTLDTESNRLSSLLSRKL